MMRIVKMVNDMLGNELVLFNNDDLIVIAECINNIENIVVMEKMVIVGFL